jgi:osmotically inducible lipoprotein OsmB
MNIGHAPQQLMMEHVLLGLLSRVIGKHNKDLINFYHREEVIMKKLLCVTIFLVFSLLSACTNRDMGTVGGAAVGGVAGNALTGGSTAGTVAGAVGGGIIGNQITR